MRKVRLGTTLWVLLLALFLMVAAGCGDDDDDDDDSGPVFDDDDDVTDDDDDASDDDDDDTVDDDDDVVDDDDDVVDDDDDVVDDDDDDDVTDDLYLAPWPQSDLETQDYDETADAGDNRMKAEDYDEFHLEWHQPYYGGTMGVVHFTDATRTTVSSYGDWGDSCIWTGTYLASQAFRYYVTGDAQAKINAIRSANALDRYLHVTETTGFIARYVGEQDALIYQGDAWCDDPNQDRCHHHETGPFAGDFWWGETSRDQYTGWFFGMSLAYDLVDDQDTKDMIADDVTEVLDTLISNNWWIRDEADEATDAAPNVLPTQKLAWSLVGYHMTGEARFKAEVEQWLADSKRTLFRIMNISFMNRYAQYYGNNLGHQNMYTLLRLGKAYFGQDDYDFFVNVFETQVHTFTRLSHNAFFNAIFMSQGLYDSTVNPDPYQEQLEQDIDEFRDSPNYVYYVDPTDGTLDPISVTLDQLMTDYPFLADIFGDVDPQSEEAHVVQEQCSTDFLWQRNPFRIEPCGSDSPSVTRPGVDYLVAYWMSAYHKFIDKTF